MHKARDRFFYAVCNCLREKGQFRHFKAERIENDWAAEVILLTAFKPSDDGAHDKALIVASDRELGHVSPKDLAKLRVDDALLFLRRTGAPYA